MSSSSSLGSPKKRPKSQVEEEDGVCCGICYAERGVSIAGEIDCCSHYFCFVCIMEWAKHESRCPICRQRFSNVRRLPMHGVFSSSRDVKVPRRDQVYHPHGNVATGPVDSYAEAKCSTCHAGTDEHLLLLCDLCDTASHTYCVGLGYTVPEGDWFCPDCTISRETNTNEESDQQNVAPAAEPSVTIDIFDIVRETGSRVVKRPRKSPLQQNLSSPSVIPLPDRLSRFKGKSPVVGVHDMQRNIQELRENWNALRSGSLRFHGNSFPPGSTVSQEEDSSSLPHRKLDDSHCMAATSLQKSTVQGGPSNKMSNESVFKDVDKAWKMMDRARRTQLTHQRTCSNSFQPGITVSQKQNSSSVSHCKSDDSHSMVATSLQKSTVQGGPSNKMSNERVFKDVGKAWKMMDRAKRTQLTHQRTCSIPQGVDKPSCSGASKISVAHCNFLELKDQQSKALDLRNAKKERQYDYSKLDKNLENRSTLKLEEKRQSRVTREELIHARDHTTHSEGYCERPLSGKVHTSIQDVPSCENGERNAAEEQSSSACLVTSADLASCRGKFGIVFSSNRDVDLVNEEKRLAKSFEDGSTRKIDEAKTEIQSLVKLNLKLLTRDKKLGVDTFKVVARQATHTILAACSSKQQKSSTSSSSSVCSHADHTPQFQKSTLMPNCCRQCFYAFVNNVVNSIMLEKVGSA
ncbi:PHD and RING finger domain-containing protein 1 [Mucuna pruriens]|uniref:PHD and RING finger domain-containing protein 1 n=1 Tax=Mucuna pruriens TaxID=157652 RepID=A0A371EJL2_MUCPR|nr:PHD and RING finger domain-containing protein 1 [Mucuna pruriens]